MDAFIESITVIDDWESGKERFRLINKGAGPDELQIFDNGKWRKESRCYEWGIVSSRIKQLKSKTDEVKDFCIWLTGCGYDFCQHEYFIKQRDKLLK